MLDLNIKTVIRILPMEDDLRAELLRDFDSYDEKKKFVVTKVCWDEFDRLEDVLEGYARNKVTEEVASGTRKVDDFNIAIHEEVQAMLEERASGKVRDNEKIAHIRQHIEELLNKKT